jgi:hypothetical protein
MNSKFFKILSLLLFIFFAGFISTDCYKKQSEYTQTNIRNIPTGLKKLMTAYPDFIDSVDENHLYWIDGTKMIYDDGKQRTFEEMFENGSLKDMMSQEYVMGEDFQKPPAENYDPGRIRNEEFFKKMYGNSSGEVQKNLVVIQWMPQSTNKSIKITSVNEVDIQLKSVSDELEKLPNEFKKYLTKLGGTFNWRVIEGTDKLSMHSFGIAIDINIEYSNFWRWEGGNKGKIIYRNKIPMEIVKIFEKYGFIWGGKWYHYDTMHFEYRPELLVN